MRQTFDVPIKARHVLYQMLPNTMPYTTVLMIPPISDHPAHFAFSRNSLYFVPLGPVVDASDTWLRYKMGKYSIRFLFALYVSALHHSTSRWWASRSRSLLQSRRQSSQHWHRLHLTAVAQSLQSHAMAIGLIPGAQCLN
jgi:hypothetical protein